MHKLTEWERITGWAGSSFGRQDRQDKRHWLRLLDYVHHLSKSFGHILKHRGTEITEGEQSLCSLCLCVSNRKGGQGRPLNLTFHSIVKILNSVFYPAYPAGPQGIGEPILPILLPSLSLSSSLHEEWSLLVQSLRSHLSELNPETYLYSPPPPPKKACVLFLESYPEPVMTLLQKITLAIQSKGGQATLLPLTKITPEFSIFIGEKPLLSQTPSPSTHILIPDLNEQLTNKEAKMRLWKEIQTVLQL